MLNKKEVVNFRNEAQTELNRVAKKFGLNLQIKTIRYSDVTLGFKVEGTYIDGPSKNDIRDKELISTFKSCYSMFDLKESDLGKTNNNGYKLIGIDMAKRKYPIIVEKDGRRYKVSTFKI
jgi:hypothetical protein